MKCIKQGPNHDLQFLEGSGQKQKKSKIFPVCHTVSAGAPQQGSCKLTLNVKNGIIEEALVETIGCSGMTHSAAMAAEILSSKTILEAEYRPCMRCHQRGNEESSYSLFTERAIRILRRWVV